MLSLRPPAEVLPLLHCKGLARTSEGLARENSGADSCGRCAHSWGGTAGLLLLLLLLLLQGQQAQSGRGRGEMQARETGPLSHCLKLLQGLPWHAHKGGRRCCSVARASGGEREK